MSGQTNITAFSEGAGARIDDDTNGTLTDNPYALGTFAFDSWYKGYNYTEGDSLIEETKNKSTPNLSDWI